ncbi:hypothetical protein SDC9_156319 [bioreactor metagenome]|uniref:Uncharacterized protein n=1 Tax=bioreactor metagenome TaxID=1076179 RepID=A0A645F437_9ZZZZ
MPVYSDDLCDALGCDCQRIISASKSIEHRKIVVNIPQTLVVDDEQRIHIGGDLFHAFQRLHNFTLSFKNERNGNNPYRKNAHVLSYTRHDGSSPGSGSSAHPGCNEYHTGAVAQQILNEFDTFLSSTLSHFGFISGTKTACSMFAQLYFHGHR